MAATDADLIRLVEAAANTLDELMQIIEAAAVRELSRRYQNKASAAQG